MDEVVDGLIVSFVRLSSSGGTWISKHQNSLWFNIDHQSQVASVV